ncbi:hypothetical protein [uncultured Ferrovibrio sp.]|jgi:hypothetical protein|uniref:hypothetical protein n=1 Tax=uncultured Ferrovibrio sp. TaxID=1576913 RepID=UPI002616FD85|nr:hypothetical protein [uncultured Ferrovibrio sp.]
MEKHGRRVSRRLYRIKGGSLTVSELPVEGFKFGDGRAFTVVKSGLEHVTVAPALGYIAELATRIAPWVDLYLGPRILSETGERWGGHCHQNQGVVFVNTRAYASTALETLFHELFHAVDWYLQPPDRRVLDAAVARGADYESEYLSDPVERRARLFEKFASYIYEGGRCLACADTPEVEVLWRIYSGKIGQEIFEAMQGFEDIAAA